MNKYGGAERATGLRGNDRSTSAPVAGCVREVVGFFETRRAATVGIQVQETARAGGAAAPS